MENVGRVRKKQQQQKNPLLLSSSLLENKTHFEQYSCLRLRPCPRPYNNYYGWAVI